MSKPIELTDENLEETLSSSSVPVLVDYWAEWCGPCKMVAPVLEELAVELDGKLTIGKVDVDSNRDSAAKQNVMSIPTLILFKDCLLYTSDAADDTPWCRSRWSPYH